MTRTTLLAAAVGLAFSGCSIYIPTTFTQNGLPEAVKVPPGNKVHLETLGHGQVTYECRAKPDAAGHEWVFVGPDALLRDRRQRLVGRYYGPPATWEALDGSKITGTQIATAPAGNNNLPLQLVKASPANVRGTLQDITYVQRLATVGGVAPTLECTGANVGTRQPVTYQADYIFWRAE